MQVLPPDDDADKTNDVVGLWHVLAPVTERGESIGLLELHLPGEPDHDVVAEIAQVAHLLAFAQNQWLQYRGRGRWADHPYGERAYIVLSLTAKSALAWQIFGGTLAD